MTSDASSVGYVADAASIGSDGIKALVNRKWRQELIGDMLLGYELAILLADLNQRLALQKRCRDDHSDF